ncbi:uracil-DNA glycosylase [Shewanella abyssi]|uniref:uracil-DNA glycosylase n=1 Tax=Shewanella abyssi TaxID=311789 RepID=UPI00201091B3|nr:uracil-DNA glycosylase [Shewanella abyssi]MCL1049104.1 uracil-DNA glycosylase [Shewanella abyssi]
MAIDLSWKEFIQQQQQQDYFTALEAFVEAERTAGKVIFPPKEQVLSAFEYTPLNEVRVVLIGQDPYHGPDQAHGLCFSVQKGVKVPPSLVNMYKELSCDIEGFTIPEHGNLLSWAQQGVLMLNTVLTVEQGKAHSHAKSGWEIFTQNVLLHLNEQPQPIIFVLWGAHAKKKGKVITAEHHQIVSGPHPSPLSAYRGFFGCKHFSHVNQLLKQQGSAAIDWQV